MTVIIRGFNKPKNCYRCNFNDSDCWCSITKGEIDRDDYTCNARCPIEQLPEAERKNNMSDIELVVKIPEEIYKASQITGAKHFISFVQIPLEVIANGTPLPEGHGILIDVKEFIKSINDWADSMDSYQANEEVEITKGLLQRYAHMIVKADKEQEGGNDTTDTGSN